MLFISKKQLVPDNANLAMVFICKLFQSNLQVGQLKSYGVSTGLVHVKMIAECVVLGWNLAQQNTSWETPVIIASLLPKVLENANCIRSKNSIIRVYEIQHVLHDRFGCRWDVSERWSHLLMLVSWQSVFHP